MISAILSLVQPYFSTDTTGSDPLLDCMAALHFMACSLTVTLPHGSTLWLNSHISLAHLSRHDGVLSLYAINYQTFLRSVSLIIGFALLERYFSAHFIVDHLHVCNTL